VGGEFNSTEEFRYRFVISRLYAGSLLHTAINGNSKVIAWIAPRYLR
jgi:hypothetical protein